MPDDVEKPATRGSARAGTLEQPDAAGIAPRHIRQIRAALFQAGVPGAMTMFAWFAAPEFLSTSMSGAASAAAAASGQPFDSLGATSEVPWNPPRAMPRRNGWERAVLLPGRIASLPLAGLGYVTDRSLLKIEQHPRFASGLPTPPAGVRRTVSFGLAKLGDLTGPGGFVALHRNLLHGPTASHVAAEYSASVLHYNRTRLTWSGRPLSLQYGYEWRPQDRLYGIGNGTSADSASDYGGQDEFVSGAMTWRPNGAHGEARPPLEATLWVGSHSRVTRTGRGSDEVSYETRFPALGDATLNQTVENLVYGVQLLQDRRAGTPHWSRGWRALVSAERFDAPIHALALRSGSSGGLQFTRYQAEFEAGVSFMRDPRTLRLFVRIADQEAGPNRDRMQLSDYSMLGGHAGLYGFSPGRFHDLDLMLTRFAYLFPLSRYFEMNVHTEWGAVYRDLWSGLRLDTLHHSYGFALHLRMKDVSRGAIGMDFSREGGRVRYSLGSSE
jgi:hypothetical protein